MYGIFFFIALFTFNYFYNKDNNNVERFKSKHKSIETIATINDISKWARSTRSQFIFYVDGKKFYISEPLWSNFHELGDTYKVLYDENEPENNLILYDKPIIPDNLNYIKGKINSFGLSDDKKSVYLTLNYFLNLDYKIERIQFFPLNDYNKLEKLYKEKKDVVIGIVPENPNRGYLNLEESLK
jgi:hypothetical protein